MPLTLALDPGRADPVLRVAVEVRRPKVSPRITLRNASSRGLTSVKVPHRACGDPVAEAGLVVRQPGSMPCRTGLLHG